MATLEKQFSDGGTLRVEYSGRGDDSVSFTADTNEGIDRETEVEFAAEGCEPIVRKVVQEGMREVFEAADGDFLLSDGGTFDVIKEKYYGV